MILVEHHAIVAYCRFKVNRVEDTISQITINDIISGDGKPRHDLSD